MSRYCLPLIALLACFPAAARGQTVDPKSTGTAKPAPTFGLAVSEVPDALYDHVRVLSRRRGQGVLLRAVAPDSPVAESDLRRNDIILSCNGTPVHDGEQLVRLLQATAPSGKARLELVRAGQAMRVSVRLASPATDTPTFPKALLKPGGPPAINVKAEVLDGGKLQVTFAFFSEGKGKLDQVTCSGSLKEIQAQVDTLGANNQIPTRVQALVDVALKRIRDLNQP